MVTTDKHTLGLPAEMRDSMSVVPKGIWDWVCPGTVTCWRPDVRVSAWFQSPGQIVVTRRALLWWLSCTKQALERMAPTQSQGQHHWIRNYCWWSKSQHKDAKITVLSATMSNWEHGGCKEDWMRKEMIILITLFQHQVNRRSLYLRTQRWGKSMRAPDFWKWPGSMQNWGMAQIPERI